MNTLFALRTKTLLQMSPIVIISLLGFCKPTCGQDCSRFYAVKSWTVQTSVIETENFTSAPGTIPMETVVHNDTDTSTFTLTETSLVYQSTVDAGSVVNTVTINEKGDANYGNSDVQTISNQTYTGVLPQLNGTLNDLVFEYDAASNSCHYNFFAIGGGLPGPPPLTTITTSNTGQVTTTYSNGYTNFSPIIEVSNLPVPTSGLVITGTTTATVSYFFQTYTYTWTITPADMTPLQVTTTALPSGEAESTYDSSPSAAIGGIPFSGSFPYHWNITTTAPGLDVSYYTGEVYGMPCCEGTYLVILKATDAAGATASQNINVVIQPSQALARFTKAQKQLYLEIAQLYTQDAADWSNGATSCSASTPPQENAVCSLLTLIQYLDLATAWYYESKAKDPSDSNYTAIAQPTPPSLALPSPDPSWTAGQLAFYNAWISVALTKEQLIGLAEATIACVNRAEGAREAGNINWEDQQVLALNHYVDLETAQLQQLLSEQAQLKSARPESGFPDFLITQNQAQQFSLGILANGLPSDVQTQLTSLGVGPDGIAALTKALGGLDPSTISGNIPLTLDPIVGPVQALITANKLRYDLNQDGAINCVDLQIVKNSFGKKVGDVGYDPRADVINDGVVNVLDLSAVARQLPAGTTCH